jgi:hypothetical protein
MEGTVCWEKVERIGVRFASISPERKTELQEWLARKLEERIPDAVAETFNNRVGGRANRPAGLYNFEAAVAL